jgi:hypothetical protein
MTSDLKAGFMHAWQNCIPSAHNDNIIITLSISERTERNQRRLIMIRHVHMTRISIPA